MLPPETPHIPDATTDTAPSSPPEAEETPWSVEEARNLYGIDRWGAGYFSINDAGEVCADLEPQEGGEITRVSIAGLMRDLKKTHADLQMPLLFRFSDILHSRIEELNVSFRRAIAEQNYGGQYRGVYPIKFKGARNPERALHMAEDELLKRGADVNAHNNNGRSALHSASYDGQSEVLRELLKRADLDLNAQDGDGDSPLIDACSQGHLMAATLLIGHGADRVRREASSRVPVALVSPRRLRRPSPQRRRGFWRRCSRSRRNERWRRVRLVGADRLAPSHSRIHLLETPSPPILGVGGKLQRSNGNTFRRPYISVRELALAGTVVLIIWRPPSLLGRTGMIKLVRRTWPRQPIPLMRSLERRRRACPMQQVQPIPVRLGAAPKLGTEWLIS